MSIRDFQERKRLERMFFSTPTLLVVALLVLVVLWGIWGTLQTKHQLDAEIAKLQREIASAQKTRDRYASKMEEINTPAGLDREARDRFNLKKPGEKAVMFFDDAAAKDTASAQGGLYEFWNVIKSWFGKIF